jgi:uncharacterized protein involved in exopolysaccharide biosynthesis
MTDNNVNQTTKDTVRYVMVAPNSAINARQDDEIDLRELWAVIWAGKWIIIGVTAVFAIASVFYALSLPNIYKSEVLLAPVAEESGLKIPGQLGGLAALAGVNLGAGGGDKTGLALEILKSREFIGRFITKHDLFVPIMAAEGWDRSDNTLIINNKIYNSAANEWVREVKTPFNPKPSLLETHVKLIKLLTVSKDRTTGMVRISVEHYSPYLAKAWVDQLVDAINEEMRSRELAEAQKSIDYLTSQINQTDIADVRTMLFSLIEEQTKTVMLANVRDEYVFKTIDPAVVSELREKPKRAIIVVVATLVAGMFSIFVVLLISFIRKQN